MRSASDTSDRSSESISNAAIFLGGQAGAGKTAVASYLYSQGWNSLDMDKADKSNKVLELLDAPADHPAFERRPLVVEGGFLEEAPRFQALINRLNLTTFWLTGSREQLIQSRLKRRAFWDNRKHILSSDWVGLIEKYRVFVRWDYEIRMWHENGKRKSFEEVLREIETHLINGGRV